jgi:hypothetical protein
MNQPEPQSVPFSVLMSDIQKGLIKIPQFQRDFVWSKEKSARLIDSILKGFPIGTFILWKTKETLRTVRNIGQAELPKTPSGDFVQHVLDGQQRLTSLFASVKGLKIKREDRVDDFGGLYINLQASYDDDLVVTDVDGKEEYTTVRIVDLLNANLTFLASFPQKFHKKLSDHKQALESYNFSVVLVKEVPIDIATEIFTRINVTGKPLSVFEIMVAKTFDAKREFDLSEEFEELIDKLKDVCYETVPPAVLLQTMALILTGECKKKVILRLKRTEFIDAWPSVVDSLCRAVDYFRNYYRIPVSRLLPYSALLAPFAYYFYKHPDKPTGDQRKFLQDFFWRASLGGRYSHSLESRLAQDIKRIDRILDGKLPTYDEPIDVTAQFIEENGWFSTSRSYVKAILCILAYREPKSFIDDSIVKISNDWLKQVNSKNYHHFFPRAYLRKQQYEEWYVNHIANITIIDDFLNKRKIRDKPPATYMKTFIKQNPNLAATMKTHLITLDAFGIWENDYDQFFKMRCRAISKELKKRIIPQKIDNRGQEVHTDDFEDIETEESSA